jgi:hypothetical protein
VRQRGGLQACTGQPGSDGDPRGCKPALFARLRAVAVIKKPDVPVRYVELLKLGFEVAQSSVAKYMVKRLGPPSQGWRTFLRNHALDIAAMDLFVAPTIGFDLLYAFVIVRLDRRDLVWINVTTNPTAEWIARQITEAFPWDDAPKYLIRDRVARSSHADCAPWASGTQQSIIGKAASIDSSLMLITTQVVFQPEA